MVRLLCSASSSACSKADSHLAQLPQFEEKVFSFQRGQCEVSTTQPQILARMAVSNRGIARAQVGADSVGRCSVCAGLRHCGLAWRYRPAQSRIVRERLVGVHLPNQLGDIVLPGFSRAHRPGNKPGCGPARVLLSDAIQGGSADRIFECEKRSQLRSVACKPATVVLESSQ